MAQNGTDLGKSKANEPQQQLIAADPFSTGPVLWPRFALYRLAPTASSGGAALNKVPHRHFGQKAA